MSSILPLIFSFFILVSCGKHSQSSEGSQGASDSRQVTSDHLTTDILNENLDNLSAYLANGGDPDAELKNGRTLLTEACHWLKFKTIAFLVKSNSSLDKKDRFGKSALMYGEEDILIKRSLFPELVLELKRNLFLAIKSSQLNEVKRILEENPPVNFHLGTLGLEAEISGFENETLLTYCVKHKLESVLRFLAQPKYSLDVNLTNGLGETPLRIARELKYINIEKLLLKLGATE